MRTRASEVATVAATDAATILAEKAAAAAAARLKLVKKKRKADRAATAKKEPSKATPAVTEPPSKKAKNKGPTASLYCPLSHLELCCMGGLKKERPPSLLEGRMPPRRVKREQRD